LPKSTLMRKVYLFSILTFLTITTNAQTTVALTADHDNTIFSHSTSQSNGAGQYFFVGKTNNGSSTHRALLHFNLSGIPANAVITSATLTIRNDKFHGASHNIGIHKVSNTWGEGTSNAGDPGGSGAPAAANDATWSSRFFGTANDWTTQGGDFTSTATATASVGGTGNIVFASNAQLVADVQSWVTTASSNNGWLVKNVNETTNGNSGRYLTREHTTVSTRPSLSVTYTVTTPVTLKQFTGALKGNDVELKWQTVTETNNDFFDVQYSRNGENFASIGRVNGAGNSNELKNYSLVHRNVSDGKNFYRLIQHDLDGKQNYTSIILVSNSTKMGMQLSPNPASEILNIKASFTVEGAKYSIVSASGQIVKSGMMNSPSLDIRQITKGMYHLSIQTSNGDLIRSSFIKN
jgi:hypothetical protein